MPSFAVIRDILSCPRVSGLGLNAGWWIQCGWVQGQGSDWGSKSLFSFSPTMGCMCWQETVQVPGKVKINSFNLIFRGTIKGDDDKLSIKLPSSSQLHQNSAFKLPELCSAALCSGARSEKFRVTSKYPPIREEFFKKQKPFPPRVSKYNLAVFSLNEKPTVGLQYSNSQGSFSCRARVNCSQAIARSIFVLELPLTLILSSAEPQLRALNHPRAKSPKFSGCASVSVCLVLALSCLEAFAAAVKLRAGNPGCERETQALQSSFLSLTSSLPSVTPLESCRHLDRGWEQQRRSLPWVFSALFAEFCTQNEDF